MNNVYCSPLRWDTLKGSNILYWSPNYENDFMYYTVFRSNDDVNFEKISETIDTVFVDTNVEKEKIYYYALVATDHSGNESPFSSSVNITVTALNDQSFVVNKYFLKPNYPNPFNPSTTIGYGLLKPGNVKVTIYDILGVKVKELVNEKQAPGYHQVIWDGKNSNNEMVSTGVYYYRLVAGTFTQQKKMILLK